MTDLRDDDPTFVGRSAELDLLAKEATILDASENDNTNRALENAVKHFTKATWLVASDSFTGLGTLLFKYVCIYVCV